MQLRLPVLYRDARRPTCSVARVSSSMSPLQRMLDSSSSLSSTDSAMYWRRRRNSCRSHSSIVYTD